MIKKSINGVPLETIIKHAREAVNQLGGGVHKDKKVESIFIINNDKIRFNFTDKSWAIVEMQVVEIEKEGMKNYVH